jgi:outer membrane protein
MEFSMKNSLRAAAAVFTLALVAGTSANAQGGGPRLAYINSSVIMEQAPGRAAALQKFEQTVAPMQARLKAMDDSLTAMITSYQQAQAGLTPEQRTARESGIREKQMGWQAEAQQIDQDASRLRMELEGPLMATLEKVINDIRTEEGYMFIFDVATEGHMIVAADKNLDITERVLVRFRTAAQLAPPAAPRPPTGAPTSNPTGVTRPPPPR